MAAPCDHQEADTNVPGEEVQTEGDGSTSVSEVNATYGIQVLAKISAEELAIFSKNHNLVTGSEVREDQFISNEDEGHERSPQESHVITADENGSQGRALSVENQVIPAETMSQGQGQIVSAAELTSNQGKELSTLVIKQEQGSGSVEILPSDVDNSFRVVMEAAVQANDYDIERRSGRVPARRRIIPAKFRDFKNPVNLNEEENSDSDFDPDEVVPVKKKSTGKRGRPRKTVEGEAKEKVESIESIGKLIRTATGYKCSYCGKSFSSKGNARVHMWTHTTARPFQCTHEDCGKSYRSNESLRRHTLTHLGIKPFECEECKKKFATNLSLKEHMTIHTEAKPYKCDTCGRSFRQVSCFRRHLITHTSDTPFACHHCDRKFSQLVYLRSHLKVHTGERPYQCDKCPKAFAHQSDLKRHKIIHTGLKPYECEVCHARFSDPSSRRRHVCEHMRTKRFVCVLCGQKFRRHSEFRVHIMRWHEGQIPVDGSPKFTEIHIDETEGDQSATDASVINIMVPTDKKGSGGIQSLTEQKNLVNLIGSLGSGIVVQEVEITPPTKDNHEVKTDSLEGENQITGNQLEMSSLPLIEAQNENGEKTVITIAEVGGSDKGDNSATLPVECAYQIIQELAGSGSEQQIYEIQYQTADNQLETSIVQVENPVQEMSEADMAAASLSAPKDGPDFVKEPDFDSQEYFNWLSNFTELSKLLKMPLSKDLFQKISHVHKSITDFMAMPSGVLNDKENFRVLMSISKDLNNIISNHLAFVMESMENNT